MMERKAFFEIPKHEYYVPQCGEHDCSANNKKNGDYYGDPSLSHFMDERRLQGKWWNENLFLQIQSIDIVHPNVENMIIVPITKRMKVIVGIQICLVSRINFDYNDNGGKKKLFLQIQSIKIMYSR